MTTSLTAGQQAFAAAVVNVRRAPGYVGKPADDVLGQIPFRAAVTILSGPTLADRLAWWWVRGLLADGRTLEGWAAQTAPGGSTLLVAVEPARPVVRPRRRGPSVFVVGEEVTVVSDALQLRRTPGDHQGEPADDLAAQLPSGAILTVAAGPARADGQTWWPLAARTDGATVEGWAAATAPDGHRQLVPAATVDALVLTRLFPGDFRQVQGWGSNTEFYARFKYDGVPLRGHNGLDFGLPVGTPLLAVDDAEVIRADFDPAGFGHFLLLDHAWGESLCAHLDRIDVRVKQLVGEGEQVGLSGNTGISTGPHLHFSIRVHPYERKDGWGGFCDPTPFMAQPPLTLPFESMELAPSPLGDELRGSPRP